MDQNQSRVIEAINATKKYLPVYWEKTVKQRLRSGCGSVTRFEDPKALESALLEAGWEPYQHPSICEGCVGFKTYDIPGMLGMDTIENVKAEMGSNFKLKVINPKHLPFSEVGFSSIRTNVTYTVIILGQEKDCEVVFTFHPGQPIEPDNALPSEQWKDGDSISIDQAIALGVRWVKIL